MSDREVAVGGQAQTCDTRSESGELHSNGLLESLSASRSGSVQSSGRITISSQTSSPSREDFKHSEAKSRSRSHSRSRSQISSPRPYTRSPPRSRPRSRFRSCSRCGYRSLHSRTRRRSRSWSCSQNRGSGGYRKYYDYSHCPLVPSRQHLRIRYNADPNCCLGIFGLSLYTTERDLKYVFAKYGPISDVSIIYDQRTRRSRGFAFVYFENVDDAKEAKENADGMELDGRRIRVDFSLTKRPRPPTPGIYRGRPTSGRRSDYYDRGSDRGYDHGYDRGYSDWVYYSRFYREEDGVAATGSRREWRNGQDRHPIYRRQSPSPYDSRGRNRSCSRSRPYSPRYF